MTSKVSDLHRLPQELKQLDQWCIAGPDKAPYVWSQRDNNLRRVSIHERDALHSFNDACAIAHHYNAGIGFILHQSDPLCCIDLDVKDADSLDKEGKPLSPSKWTTVADLERYTAIIDHFQTYSELSTSGKGAHLWLFGNIGKGVHREGVEVYSQERFIICTGNAFGSIAYSVDSDNRVNVQVTDHTARPLTDQKQESLDGMVSQMRASGNSDFELVEEGEEQSDARVLEIAMAAENADKFNMLCNGEWEGLGYPSQSEADLSLMSMFTFYSKSNEQCKRLFRMTKLGKREKATRDDVYLNRTLRIIRGRQDGEKEAQRHGKELAESLVQRLQTQHIQQIEAAPKAVEAADLPELTAAELQWPPGLAGAIAGFIYNSSYRPVKEVSIVATLGLLAGICGKAFCLQDTGLNIYVTLVARSGIGKEGMHSGISKLVGKIASQVPMASQFVTFTDFVSGPALMKHCSTNPSFVNVAGEWGQKLKRMSAEDGRDGPMQQLRTVMTNLYQKSGPTSIAGGLSYSNKDNDIDSVSGVNFSLIGESTPGTFFDSLTSTMMEDGFLSRFTIVEYNGKRPKRNPNKLENPDPYLIDALAGLCTHAATIISRFEYQNVEFTKEAHRIANKYDDLCDIQVDKHEDEGFRQMWNRAHLKALRIAGLLAVADNWFHPLINEHHMQWAIDLINRDITLVTGHLMGGDVGTDDSSRDKKLLNLVKEYAHGKTPPSYNINKDMQQKGIIPRRYLQIRTHRISSFQKHRLGANYALDISVRSLIDSGYLVEMDKASVLAQFSKTEKCFCIVDL